MKFERVEYSKLNARQKENFNFQKVSAVLADYGYVTLRLSDDWEGADFIAIHRDGSSLRVQLKGRLSFQKKYEGKNLWITFAFEDSSYLYPHDELLKKVDDLQQIKSTQKSWIDKGNYHFPTLSVRLNELLAPYQINGDTRPIPVEAIGHDTESA